MSQTFNTRVQVVPSFLTPTSSPLAKQRPRGAPVRVPRPTREGRVSAEALEETLAALGRDRGARASLRPWGQRVGPRASADSRPAPGHSRLRLRLTRGGPLRNPPSPRAGCAHFPLHAARPLPGSGAGPWVTWSPGHVPAGHVRGGHWLGCRRLVLVISRGPRGHVTARARRGLT